MKNIHVLPTDKPSILIKDIWKNTFSLVENFNTNHTDFKAQNIYITSDEEIKEGDWCILFKDKKDYIFKALSVDNYSNCKKIILTTDQDLIKDGVQVIDDEFLEWFVKNLSCEKVEYDKNYNRSNGKYYYKIIIPKEEPKQETLEEVAETIADKIRFQMDIVAMDFENQVETSMKVFYKVLENLLFEAEKEQQERMYSDEEVKQAFKVGFSIGYGSDIHAIDEKNRTCEEWFEQFKKKEYDSSRIFRK